MHQRAGLMSPPSPPAPIGGSLRVMVAAATVAALVLALSGCRGSDDSSQAGGFESTGVPVLDAVALSRPSEALDGATDPTLKSHGDLLLGDQDLATGFVLEDQWCDSVTGKCVTVGGDEAVLFGDEPLESFVLEPDYRVDNPEIEVIDVRALHHPVNDELRLVVEVKPVSSPWSTEYDRVLISGASGDSETSFVGRITAFPGLTTRYELRRTESLGGGRTKIVMAFSDGIQDGDRVELTIKFEDPVFDIERSEVPLDVVAPVWVYRSPEPLPDVEGASDNGDEAIRALIGAIADGNDTTKLVKQGSAAASAVEALGGAGRVMEPRRDPNDPQALCWDTFARGAFCERWHGGVTDDDVLTSWSVEGTPIDDLVVTRAGSMPGSSAILLRSVTTDVVLGAVTVKNVTAGTFYLTLYEPAVLRGDRVRNAIDGDGDFEVEVGATERGGALIESTDMAFDLVYPLGGGVNTELLRFGAETGSVGVGSSESTEDLDAAAVGLASFFQERRYDEAAAQAAPGSPAEAYLSAAAATFPEAFLLVGYGDYAIGSTEVCAKESEEELCTTLEVTALDDEGRIVGLSIDDVDTEELIVVDKSAQSGDFSAAIESAIVWPKWGTFVRWTVKNGSEADVDLQAANLIDSDSVITEPNRPLFEELPAKRAVTGVSRYDSEGIDGAVEFEGTGSDEVRSLTLVVPLTDSFEAGSESGVELEADETEVVTPSGTELAIPGAWSDGYGQTEETGSAPGVGTSLGRMTLLHREDLSVIIFSPDFSPAELTTDELVAEINTVVPLTDVTTEATSTSLGDPTGVLGGKTEFFSDAESALIFPGSADLVFVVWEDTVPEDVEVFIEVVTALTEQLGLDEPQ